MRLQIVFNDGSYIIVSGLGIDVTPGTNEAGVNVLHFAIVTRGANGVEVEGQRLYFNEADIIALHFTS